MIFYAKKSLFEFLKNFQKKLEINQKLTKRAQHSINHIKNDRKNENIYTYYYITVMLFKFLTKQFHTCSVRTTHTSIPESANAVIIGKLFFG